MARIGFLILASLFAFPTGALALDVRISEDKISIHADKVPLQNVLKRLAAQGIRVQVGPGINPLVTASFEGRDIRRGLESVLRPHNYVLLWDSVEEERGPALRLREIQIFEPGRKNLMRPLVPRSLLPIRRNPADGSLYVKDEILIRLGSGKSLEDLRKLLIKINGEIIEGPVAKNIYRIRVPENSDLSAIPGLAEAAGVGEAEPNYAYPMPGPEGSSLDIPAASLFAPSKPYGNAAPVAVLDSGMRVETSTQSIVSASYDALNPGSPIEDSLGHGTQMALIASGAVKPYGSREDKETIPVIPIRIFDDNGFTSDFHVLRSIDFAVSNGARVLSLSWGSETKSPFMEEAMNYAVSKGLIVVASAGNEPTGKPYYPAAYESVIGVGALAPDGGQWEDSNFGDSVKVYAPGFARMPVGYKGAPGMYAGTSISAAYTAHVIAGFLSQNPGASASDIFKHLLNTKNQ